MKKIILTLILAGCTLAAAAQKYVRIDTVYTPYFDFDYDAWLSDTTHPLYLADSWNVDACFRDDSGGYHNIAIMGDRMEYNYIEGGADIYGIDVWTHNSVIASNFHPTIFQEYLLLYDATPDSLIELAQIPFIPTDSAYYMGEYHFTTQQVPHSTSRECSDHLTRSQEGFAFWRRFFFDNPIHVKDSFYVGHTNNNYFRQTPEELNWTFPEYWCVYSTDCTFSDDIYFDSTCWMPTRNCKARFVCPYDSSACRALGVPMNEWLDFETHEFFLNVPILRTFDTIWAVDTPACTPVYDLTIMSRYGNTVSLRWRHDGTHDEWQVSYGPQGTPPDEGTWVESHSNIWRFTDTLGIPMVAYVRTVCRELDTLRYSEWSDPVEWQVFPDGFDPMDRETDGLVSIRPNPSTDMVTVASEYEMFGIEVFNASGMKYLEPIAGRHSASFSVQGWPKGLYLIVVHTPQGDISKKLVVGD